MQQMVQVNLFPTYCTSPYMKVTPTCSDRSVLLPSWSNVPLEDDHMLQLKHVGLTIIYEPVQ
jgi:hypothetical protein